MMNQKPVPLIHHSSFIIHHSLIMSSTRLQLSEKERAARDVFARLAVEADKFEGYAHPHAGRVAAIAEALAAEAARKHLAEWAAIEFDPRVVRALLALSDVPELRSYARRGGDEGETKERARESGGAE